MKRYYTALLLLVVSCCLHAQPVKKPTPTSKSGTDKMLEDVMNQSGMSEGEKAKMREAMGQATQASGEMKSAGLNTGGINTDVPKIPVKQTALLQQMPLLQTPEQLSDYFKTLLAECRKNIPQDLEAGVNGLIDSLGGDQAQLSALPIMLFMNKQIRASVYAALKIVQSSTRPLMQNNCAFVLQQAGYPAKALPVFKYLLQKSNTAEVNNNLAQCYLSLGDREEAKKYFFAGIAKDPNSSEMHCGLGLILSEEGHTEEAATHIAESLKNGYSEVAEALAIKHHVKLKLKEIRKTAPEYFNPQKFKPVQPAGVMEEMPQVEADRLLVEERFNQAQSKSDEFNEKINGTDEKEMKTLLSYHFGTTGTTPFGRKARYMMQLITEERSSLMIDELERSGYEKKDSEYSKQFEDKFEQIQHTSFGTGDDWAAKQCAAHVENLNNYLKLTKVNYEDYERLVLPRIYDVTNQALFWESILVSGDAYKQLFYAEVQSLYGYINGLSQMQSLYPTPDWIYSSCKNYKQDLEKLKLEEIQEQFVCPISVKVGGEYIALKMTCRGTELEGGKILKLGYEEDSRTGEFSVEFGLGADLDLEFVNAGAKGTMYFKFAKDFTPLDMGLKAEAAAGFEHGVLYTEEKITATMGISSINVDAVHQGRERNLFNVDATKD